MLLINHLIANFKKSFCLYSVTFGEMSGGENFCETSLCNKAIVIF